MDDEKPEQTARERCKKYVRTYGSKALAVAIVMAVVVSFVGIGTLGASTCGCNTSDGTVAAQSGEELGTTELGEANPVVYSSDAGYTAAINSVTGEQLWRFDGNDAMVRPFIDPNREFVITGEQTGLTVNLYRLDMDNGTVEWQNPVVQERVQDVAMGPEGEVLIVGDYENGMVYRVNPSTGETVWAERIHATGESVTTVRVGPDGQYAYTGGTDSNVTKVDVEDGTPVWTHEFAELPHGSVNDIIAGPDGRTVTYGTGPSVEADLVQLDASDGSVNWQQIFPTEDAATYQTGLYHDAESDIIYGLMQDPDQIHAIHRNGTIITRTDTPSTKSQRTGMQPLDMGTFAFGGQGEVMVMGHEPELETFYTSNVHTSNIDGNVYVARTALDRPVGELRLSAPNRLSHGETSVYSVFVDVYNRSYRVTGEATTQSADETRLTVDESNATLTATSNTELTGDVDVTAHWNRQTDTQVVWIGDFCSYGTVQQIALLFQDWTFTALLVATFGSVIGVHYAGAFGGVSFYWLVGAIGWFGGFISTGMMIIVTVATLFIGLNVAANIDYTVRR